MLRTSLVPKYIKKKHIVTSSMRIRLSIKILFLRTRMITVLSEVNKLNKESIKAIKAGR